MCSLFFCYIFLLLIGQLSPNAEETGNILSLRLNTSDTLLVSRFSATCFPDPLVFHLQAGLQVAVLPLFLFCGVLCCLYSGSHVIVCPLLPHFGGIASKSFFFNLYFCGGLGGGAGN